MTILVKKDRTKLLEQLNEYYSEETEFLHASLVHKPVKKSDVISISLNFLYLLLLFRTKERERVEKAIEKLDQLLYFQSKSGQSYGNFPVFIHEYPHCQRYFEVIDSLFPLYWIYKEFASILEPRLKGRLKDALLDGLACIDRLDEGREYSYLLSVQRAALMLGIGRLLNEEDWIKKGEPSLIKQAKRGPQTCWGSPRSLSKILISLELCPDSQSSWETFWSYIHQTWVPSMSAYNGPALFEHFEKDQQEGTLYHLYMEKVHRENPSLPFSALTLLEGELIQNKEAYQCHLSPIVESLNNYSFESVANSFYAVNFFNLDSSQWVKTGGFYPFKLLLKNRERVDSFVMQMGGCSQIKAVGESKWLITIDPGEELDACFFLNRSSKAEILIQGEKATAFRLDQSLTVHFEAHTLTLSFPNSPKEVWGQLLQSNRRSQIIDQDNQVHDTHLYFRQLKALDRPFDIEVEIQSLKKI